MFAIAEIKGHQYKVSEGDKFEISRLPEAKEGDKVKFNEVLLISDKEVTLGMPFISGAYIEVKVLGEEKGDKIRIFKMKAKKRYRKTQGHRQTHTNVEVIKIAASGGAKSVEKKSEVIHTPKIEATPVKEAAVKSVKKAPVKKLAAEKKAPTAKKAPAKKPAKKSE